MNNNKLKTRTRTEATPSDHGLVSDASAAANKTNATAATTLATATVALDVFHGKEDKKASSNKQKTKTNTAHSDQDGKENKKTCTYKAKAKNNANGDDDDDIDWSDAIFKRQGWDILTLLSLNLTKTVTVFFTVPKNACSAAPLSRNSFAE